MSDAPLRIGNGAGFLGDQLTAPAALAEGAQLDYLTLEHLAELTMSILARSREKNPQAGYALDIVAIAASLLPSLRKQPRLKIVANSGGMNPTGCAAAVARVLVDGGLGEMPIGVVEGDDLLPRLAELKATGVPFENFDTGRPIAELKAEVVSANAYLGARGIVEALDQGARIVLTGRVADASLTVGPAAHHFGWSWDDLPRLAAASVAGHVIECGAQCTGGVDPHWKELDLARVGYPIAELSADGSCVITKPAGGGGVVNRRTVCEQLVYEIGDPRRYLTPDVEVDFTTIEVEDLGNDRVRLSGATGRAAPARYKVSLAYRDGYTASGQLLAYGPDCVEKARYSAKMILDRLAAVGITFDRAQVECLGAGEGVPGLHARPRDLREVVMRLAVADPRREAVERFLREFAPLATSGPAGLAGYTAATSAVRPVFAYWPTLVPRSLAPHRANVRTAAEWLSR